MAAQAHHYHHRCFPRFRRVDWNPSRWCTCSETMSLHHSWGCTTFQTASHIHVIHIWSDWAPLTAVNGYGSTLIWLPLMVGRSLRSWIFGLLAIWLLITSSEDFWDGKIYWKCVYRNYILWACYCAIWVTRLVHPLPREYSTDKKPIFLSPNPYFRIHMFIDLLYLYVLGLPMAVFS